MTIKSQAGKTFLTLAAEVDFLVLILAMLVVQDFVVVKEEQQNVLQLQILQLLIKLKKPIQIHLMKLKSQIEKTIPLKNW